MNIKENKPSLIILACLVSYGLVYLGLLIITSLVFTFQISVIISTLIFTVVLCLTYYKATEETKIASIPNDCEVYKKTLKNRFSLPDLKDLFSAIFLYSLFIIVFISTIYSIIYDGNYDYLNHTLVLSIVPSILFIIVFTIIYETVKLDGIFIRNSVLYRVENDSWKNRITRVRYIEDIKVSNDNIYMKIDDNSNENSKISIDGLRNPDILKDELQKKIVSQNLTS